VTDVKAPRRKLSLLELVGKQFFAVDGLQNTRRTKEETDNERNKDWQKQAKKEHKTGAEENK
jgi:hypothetical protein